MYKCVRPPVTVITYVSQHDYLLMLELLLMAFEDVNGPWGWLVS